ncbi:CHAT domain-containing protein [Lentzea sp. BCCO 10_0798]|uniref:CHAT domain-containing protein n=1 Tax=Lentzea kristufekii TaxID=3095430 RepID=A0ABU4U6J6_9PSEU|nr:CHAT domain-containing protein [Lentzea sp. BCCO 10_0798]MDX8056193.1 CHAT domain-containing protein [Lentzea sp. BCCO 10_0798]
MQRNQMVDAIHEIVVSSTDTLLRETGFVPRPQVHLLLEHLDRPYVGYVETPDFSRGADAAWAIRGLGILPSVLAASRLLVVWEHLDLCTALEIEVQHTASALMVLEASLDDHVLTAHPLTVDVGPPSPFGITAIVVAWHDAVQFPQADLPGPVAEILSMWRLQVRDDPTQTVAGLEQAGYRISWVKQDLPETRPVAESAAVAAFLAVEEALSSGSRAACENAVAATRRVVAELADDDGLHLANLATALFALFEHDGDIEILREAVEAARSVVTRLKNDHDQWAGVMSVMSCVLRTWFEYTGDADALSEAVSLARRAADAVPQDDPARNACLTNFCSALHTWWQHTSDPSVLDDMVRVGRSAVKASSPSDAHYSGAHSTLSLALRGSYEHSGDIALLDEAITTARSAARFTPARHPKQTALAANLAGVLQARYDLTGELPVLDEAITLARQAVSATPATHPDGPMYRSALSIALKRRFERTADPDSLHEAISAARECIELTPHRHPNRPLYLANLAAVLRAQFHNTQDLPVLDESIALLHHALADIADDHRHRAFMTSNLANAFRARFEFAGEIQDLDEAIMLGRKAVGHLAEGHPQRAKLSYNSAMTLMAKYELVQDDSLLSQCLLALETTASDRTAEFAVRIDAAEQWGRIASNTGRLDEAARGFATAVHLLPRLVPRNLEMSDSEHWLARYSGIAGDAAACMIELGCPEHALELLEMGRAVLLSQAIDGRHDLTQLREHSQELADRYGWLCAQLDTDPAESEPADQRRAMADELDAVIDRIRSLPGLDRFLLAPTAFALIEQAAEGPLVVINTSRYRCDALIVTPGGVQLQPLPALTEYELQERLEDLLHALNVDRPSPIREAQKRAERTIRDVLAWLSDTITAPILNALEREPNRSPARLWWIPTGLLSFFPLHAAGSTLDQVVSSYAPTIRSLAHARSTSSPTSDQPEVLVVAMPTTPGERPLRGATAEAKIVSDRMPATRLLTSEAATRDAVLAGLADSTWTHFACHGVNNPTSPSDSHLLTHDHQRHPLTARAVARLRLQQAEFAYLSACHTAASTTKLADEAIHVASAFHLAGYRHVVGTLWAIEDQAAVDIAEHFYSQVNGAEHSAVALHSSILRMREQHPKAPSLWASHIHIGA